ncbi:MAG: CHAT domain-containing protein [Flavobacteriales bacterium]|nr:CHAT domain-containing protein [Flavobacteriales bacterium]
MVNKVLYIFILFPYLIYGQTIGKDYVISENKRASELNREGKFLQANKILDNLLLSLEDENSEEKLFAATYQIKAKVVQSLGNYEESSKLARQSLMISLKDHDSLNMADNYNTIGVNHYFEADYDSTTYYYEKSLDIKRKIKTDPYALAVSTYNLALVYDDLGQTDKAMEFYEQAEKYLIESKHSKNFLSDVYVGIALIHFYSGDISKAELYAEKAMENGLISYGEYNPNMTFVYTTYANILEADKKYDESISLLEKNLKIRRSTYGEFHRWTCETYYDLANAYVLVKNYDKAEMHYKKALEIGKKINSRQYLANARNFLAQLYIDRGIHLDESERLLQASLATNLNIYGDKSDLVAENYLHLAKVYKRKEEGSHFHEYIQKSLDAANYNQNDLNSVIGPFQVLDALMLVSEWYNEIYEKEKSIEYLIDRYELIDQKMSLIKHTQNNFSSDRSRINFANKYREVFEKDLGLCWLLYHKTLEQKYLQKAFELSETNRNTTLLTGLQGIEYRSYGDIPKDKLELENSTKKALEKVKMDIFFEKTASEPDKEYYRSLLDDRILLSNKLDSIYKDFYKNYPKFKIIESANESTRIEDVQAQLNEETQLIAYFLGEQSLFSFNITKDTVSLLRADISDKLIKSTNDFKNHLSKREDINELSYDLYMYLLGQQLNREKKNLIIVADNVLNYIPFEILRSSNGSLLIENYNVSYNGSVRIYLELKKDFFNYETPNNWVGFAPKYFNDATLSSSIEEVNEIAKLTDGVKFIEGAANKENFRLHNKEFSIIHLAMHAKIDNENPLYNRLLFDDEELTASEIYTSTSKANLAVLSACNTGFGKIEKGEGVMSMARAFHYSGIPSVLMSLWKVPDQETKIIMTDFYRYLKKGKSKSESLRMAKLSYLDRNDHNTLDHPYYWSGFVINGNTDAMDLNSGNSSIQWIILSIFSLLLLGFLYQRFK